MVMKSVVRLCSTEQNMCIARHAQVPCLALERDSVPDPVSRLPVHHQPIKTERCLAQEQSAAGSGPQDAGPAFRFFGDH